mmetsp:Transcript_46905/g.114251  ORF Transcript_46905/g.114251 Transcript_46905/m.114251 type:complete len:270 (-) Transcript_46905:762-1571(-)
MKWFRAGPLSSRTHHFCRILVSGGFAVTVLISAERMLSAQGVRGEAREGDSVSDVVEACSKHHEALEAEPEACVRHAPKLPQVHVPRHPWPVDVDSGLGGAPLEQAHALLPLAPPDDLPALREEHVHCSNGLAVAVEAHVEGLDLFGVVVHDHGPVEDLLSEIALLLCRKVSPPVDLDLKLVLRVEQELYRLCVRDARKGLVHNRLNPLDQRSLGETSEALSTCLLEEGHVIWERLKQIGKSTLQHPLSTVHGIPQVRKGHLRLEHPEL